ncbi:MAG: methyltransferase domain-containing protein [Magnetococcus sp. DMHC-8]
MIDKDPLVFHPAARLDRGRLGLAWRRAAPTMGDPDGLLAQLGQQLLERLDDIRLTPACILELGDRTGLMADQLQKRWPRATVVALDLVPLPVRSAGRLWPWRARPRHLVGEAPRLPFSRGQFDLVISSMALHWSGDLAGALREIRRVLAPDRLLLFTVAGAASLWELHACLDQLDQARHGRVRVRQPALPSLSGLGDLLSASGFVLPVVDRERLSLPVPDTLWLLRHLQAMGAGNHLQGRPRHGLLGKSDRAALEHLYAERFRQADGTLPCTLELLFGHAWKGVAGAAPPATCATVY